MRFPAAALCILAVPAAAEPRFVDRAKGLPVPQIYSGGWEHYVGGGVAAFDCNGDARPDLFAAGGTEPARLFINETEPGGDIRFTAGAAPEISGVTGAYPLDIDSDGILDLFILRVGANRLWRGGPGCSFTDVTEAWGFQGGDRWSTAFSATWEDGQDRPTLAIGNYVNRDDPNGPFEACDVNELHRPGPDGYGAPEILSPGYCALSMLISDWQRSGAPELRISNDRHYYVRGGFEEMWRLDPLSPRTEQDGWPKISLWGMGIASRDLTGDGLPEVMMTSMRDQLLQINTGTGFRNAPYSIGTYAQRPYRGDDGRPSTGWHAEFGDIDNDGRADLFIAKGNVDQMPSNAIHDPNNLLMQQPDGTFSEMAEAAGVDRDDRSRGAALVDLNADGRLDIVVMNRRVPMEIWQNATEGTGHWLAVEPKQDGTNTRAVGAWIELRVNGRTEAREVTVGGGHAGGQAGPLHFGLGDADMVEIRVIWPDGEASDWMEVRADRRVEIWRDESGVTLR